MQRREHGTGSLLRVQYTDAEGAVRRTKTWYLQFYLPNGKRVRESARTEDKHEAQKKLTRRLAEVGAGRPISDVKGLKYETVRDAWIVYPRKRGALRTIYTKADGTQTASGLLHLDKFLPNWTSLESMSER